MHSAKFLALCEDCAVRPRKDQETFVANTVAALGAAQGTLATQSTVEPQTGGC